MVTTQIPKNLCDKVFIWNDAIKKHIYAGIFKVHDWADIYFHPV